MRRKKGTLLPFERRILTAILEHGEIHGFALAHRLAEASGAKKMTAFGSLYKALRRLENQHLLESRWEDPTLGESEGRPRRRLYDLTGRGREVARAVLVESEGALDRLALS